MEQLNSIPIDELLSRYCEGEVTEEERQAVEVWIEQSDENCQTAKQVYTLYLAADTLNIMKRVDIEKAFSKVRGEMIDRKRRAVWEWTQRIAAVLFIPLLISSLMLYFQSDSAEVAQMIEVKTNPGMTTSVTLPDSTVVYLNSESSLTYPSRFDSDVREVKLRGEAYFAVKCDKQKQFIVLTPSNMRVRVYGTQFNVEAYSGDSEIRTTLVSGSVSLCFEVGKQMKEVWISPGEKAIYSSVANSLHVNKTFVEGDVAWKDGKLIFNDTPFDKVLQDLSKRYHVDFIIKHKSLQDYSFTGVFTNQRLERILEYFKVSSNIRFRYLHNDDNGIKQEREKIEIY